MDTDVSNGTREDNYKKSLRDSKDVFAAPKPCQESNNLAFLDPK